MITKDAHQKLKEKLIEIAELNKSIAQLSIFVDEGLKSIPLDLKSLSNDLKRVIKSLESKVKEIDRLILLQTKESQLALHAADKASNLATLGLGLEFLEDVITTTSSSRLKSILEYSDDETLREAIVNLEVARLTFIVALGEELLAEKDI